MESAMTVVPRWQKVMTMTSTTPITKGSDRQSTFACPDDEGAVARQRSKTVTMMTRLVFSS